MINTTMRVEGWKEMVMLVMLGMVGRGRTADLVAPDPPNMLTVDVLNGTHAMLAWRPPSPSDKHSSSFKLKLVPLSEPSKLVRSISVNKTTSTLSDLTPGATYEIQVYSVLEGKAYISTNFTTKPKRPKTFVQWFRNETTLLVQWEASLPAGFYTDYKVSIQPEDALYSETYTPRQGDPPTYAQAAFNGLFPGRAYNISVSTVSEGQISDPLTAQYRTVPLRPSNVTFDPLSVGPDSFTVRWSAPDGPSESDWYHVAIGIQQKTPQIVDRGNKLMANFTENLRPGRTYSVIIRTVSGSLVSWPATANVTTRPLPVRDLRQEVDPETSEMKLVWEPNPESQQDSFKVIESINRQAGLVKRVVVEMKCASQQKISMVRIQPICPPTPR